jgi:hypothetical protein
MKNTNGPWKIVPDNDQWQVVPDNGPWKIVPDAAGQWTVVPDAAYLRDIEHRLTRLEIMLYISITTSIMSFVGIHIFDSFTLLRGILP